MTGAVLTTPEAPVAGSVARSMSDGDTSAPGSHVAPAYPGPTADGGSEEQTTDPSGRTTSIRPEWKGPSARKMSVHPPG